MPRFYRGISRYQADIRIYNTFAIAIDTFADW